MSTTTDSAALISPNQWLEFCYDAYFDAGIDLAPEEQQFRSFWETFPPPTQTLLNTHLATFTSADQNLNYLLSRHDNLYLHPSGTKRIPDPSDFFNFRNYVTDWTEIRAARRALGTAVQNLSNAVDAAAFAAGAGDGMGARGGEEVDYDILEVLRGFLGGKGLEQKDRVLAETGYTRGLREEYWEIERRKARGELAGDWVRGGSVGTGSYGDATIWLRQDWKGVVIDRVVIKDSKANPDNDVLWVNAEEEQPTEVASMLRLNGLDDANYVVKLRNWAITADHTMYKLFLEFCPHGDLWGMAQACISDKDNEHTSYIPEPFAWSVLESMTETLTLMEQGDSERVLQGWSPIVHRDLKPANMFLAKNTTDLYPNYPIAKMGDWGLSVFLEHPNTQFSFKTRCEYEPPEICNSRILPPGQKMWPNTTELPTSMRATQLSQKANVWGVGFVLWSLLSGNGYDGEWIDAQGPTGQVREERTLDMDEISTTQYSARLRGLISRCLRYQPADRPSLDQLRYTIDAATRPAGTSEDLSQGLRYASRDDPANATRFPVKLPEDKFTLGTKVVDGKWLDGGFAPAPPPREGLRREALGKWRDGRTPDWELFGTPGRTLVGGEEAEEDYEMGGTTGSRRRAIGDGGGGDVSRRRRRGARPTSADISGRSSFERARGGAERSA